MTLVGAEPNVLVACVCLTHLLKFTVLFRFVARYPSFLGLTKNPEYIAGSFSEPEEYSEICILLESSF